MVHAMIDYANPPVGDLNSLEYCALQASYFRRILSPVGMKITQLSSLCIVFPTTLLMNIVHVIMNSGSAWQFTTKPIVTIAGDAFVRKPLSNRTATASSWVHQNKIDGLDTLFQSEFEEISPLF